MYHPWGKNCYFESKDPTLLGKWERLRKIGQDVLSLETQLKLEWIVFYHTVGENPPFGVTWLLIILWGILASRA